jgi:peroxiredoxin
VLSEGSVAPEFELPALVDGEKRRVSLAEFLGVDVVILAFYPADFNPACDEESCDLGELDLFTMQKDVTILGISPDSVYSHRAFAERYDLNIPLLADTDGEVASKYDLDFVDDMGQRLVKRAVVVIDHEGVIQYSWCTDDITKLPRVMDITDSLTETGGDDTAFARYQVGHAHYIEARRAFTVGMEGFQQTDWMMSQYNFQRAREEFEEAADQFDTSARFVDDESLAPVYKRANEKATALWQAADWLAQSASAYSSGSGTEGQELRDDAEAQLVTAREYDDPPDPDGEWPPEVADTDDAAADGRNGLPTESAETDNTLGVDVDEGVSAADGSDTDNTVAASDADDIDDEELAAIQDEIAASDPSSASSTDTDEREQEPQIDLTDPAPDEESNADE